jgi:Phosphate-starvation-inducible E family
MGRRLQTREDMNRRQIADQDENALVASRRAGDTGHGTWFLRYAPRVFEQIEHWVGVGIGVLLSLAALLALAGAVVTAWDAIVQWPQLRSLFGIVDRLLFVLMIIELLHTVRSSIQSHQLSCEPFLIVGRSRPFAESWSSH